jgi:hypothetical protein
VTEIDRATASAARCERQAEILGRAGYAELAAASREHAAAWRRIAAEGTR